MLVGLSIIGLTYGSAFENIKDILKKVSDKNAQNELLKKYLINNIEDNLEDCKINFFINFFNLIDSTNAQKEIVNKIVEHFKANGKREMILGFFDRVGIEVTQVKPDVLKRSEPDKCFFDEEKSIKRLK
jgi:hypothetical protein